MRFLILLCIFSLFLTAQITFAAEKAILIDIEGPIGPATHDHVDRGFKTATDRQAKLIILRVDTPGGLETSMRDINKIILASRIPVVAYVAPAGARAASAGTFILYASHLAAMAPGTNVGAASPVPVNGFGKQSSVMEKKIGNDSAAYIRSLAALRGRNSQWAEEAVRSAVSLSAEEALKLNVINVIANDISDLLKKINGKTITLRGNIESVSTQQLEVQYVESDWRFRFLSVITQPNVAYILLLIGIYGLFFEIYNPGLILPGVLGGISLLIAFYAFHVLPISYAGFSLLILGICFIFAEAFVSSYGVLGIGGCIAFVTGSIFLIDTADPGFNIAWQIILMMALMTVIFIITVMYFTYYSLHKKITTGQDALIGCDGVVIGKNGQHIVVKIKGEIWNAEASSPLEIGEKVRVYDIVGLLLKVKKLPENNKKEN